MLVMKEQKVTGCVTITEEREESDLKSWKEEDLLTDLLLEFLSKLQPTTRQSRRWNVKWLFLTAEAFILISYTRTSKDETNNIGCQASFAFQWHCCTQIHYGFVRRAWLLHFRTSRGVGKSIKLCWACMEWEQMLPAVLQWPPLTNLEAVQVCERQRKFWKEKVRIFMPLLLNSCILCWILQVINEILLKVREEFFENWKIDAESH